MRMIGSFYSSMLKDFSRINEMFAPEELTFRLIDDDMGYYQVFSRDKKVGYIHSRGEESILTVYDIVSLSPEQQSGHVYMCPFESGSFLFKEIEQEGFKIRRVNPDYLDLESNGEVLGWVDYRTIHEPREIFISALGDPDNQLNTFASCYEPVIPL